MTAINFNQKSELVISKEEFILLLNKCGVGFYGFENISSNDIEKFEIYFFNASFSIKNNIITIINMDYVWND